MREKTETVSQSEKVYEAPIRRPGTLWLPINTRAMALKLCHTLWSPGELFTTPMFRPHFTPINSESLQDPSINIWNTFPVIPTFSQGWEPELWREGGHSHQERLTVRTGHEVPLVVLQLFSNRISLRKSFFLSGPRTLLNNVRLDNTSLRTLPFLKILRMSVINRRLVRLSRWLPMLRSQRWGINFLNPPWLVNLVPISHLPFRAFIKVRCDDQGHQTPPWFLFKAYWIRQTLRGESGEWGQRQEPATGWAL